MKEVYLVMISGDSYNPVHTEIKEVGSKIIFQTLEEAQKYIKDYPYSNDCSGIFRLNVDNLTISFINSGCEE